MSDSRLITKQYLQGDAKTLQLATVRGGKPWIATVYFVVDDELNIYWLSWPERRHSREIAENSAVAGAVVIKADQPVIGVQLAGVVSEVTDDKTIESVMKLYVAKYDQGHKFREAVAAGTNKHHMYKLTPREILLFDEVTYPSDSPVAVQNLL